MTPDLHKRLKEAAYKYAKRVVPECISSYVDFFNSTRADFRNGAKYGYKEAIAQAKEWLETNIANQVEMMCAEGPLMMSKTTFLADFENNMNKLWEE